MNLLGDLFGSINPLSSDKERDTSQDNVSKPLEKSEQAKPYQIKSQWKTYPVGVINIKDGKLDASGLEWNPLE